MEQDQQQTGHENRAHWAFFERLDEVTSDIEDPGRWAMLRDVAVFQGKLALDALRDLALSPISMVAALLGFIRDPHKPGRYFYSLMKLGKRSDHAIGLFGAAEKAGLELEPDPGRSVDELVDRIEGLVVKQYEQGGVTATAKESIDKALDKLHEAAKKEMDSLRAQHAKERGHWR